MDEIAGPAAAPCTPEIDENGVDIAQIRALLDKPPAERLSLVTDFMNALLGTRARNGIRGPG